MRYTFGGQAVDFLIEPPSLNARVLKSLANQTGGTAWSAQTGGSQYTDLQAIGTDPAPITTDDEGRPRPFYGPDGVSDLWVSFGGSRFLLRGREIGSDADVAGLMANAASLVAQAVGAAATDTDTPLGSALNSTYAPKQFLGMVLPSVLNDYTALQAAADTAASTGQRLVAAGTINTTSTLTVNSDCDLSQLTYNYTGTGTALLVGDTTAATHLRTVELPKVINTGKVGTGWAAGTVGVKLVNLNACKNVEVPHVQGFETGLLVYGQGSGFAYCNVILGSLQTNKRNLVLDHDTAGWVNQNTFMGGRYWHESTEGTNVSGARHLLIVNTATNLINNNLFLGASLEGDTPEFHADIAGTFNTLVACRWEATTPKVRWQNSAARNQILYGYNAYNIVETFGTGTSSNTIADGQTTRINNSGGTSLPALWLENAGGSSNPADVVMGAGATVAGSDPAASYAVARSQLFTDMKAVTDSQPRLRLQHNAGRVYFGNGVAAPTVYMGIFGSTGISVAGILNAATDNANDLGSASNRWRDVYAARAFRVPSFATGSRPTPATVGVGGMVYDSTLSKPIWSDGTAWRDATGTAV